MAPRRRKKPTESDYLVMLLRLMPREQLDSWLSDNPSPNPWKPYEWAYSEMIISERFVFRNIRNA